MVRRFSGRSGEEVVVLTDRAGMPYFWPNVFVTSDYRNTASSPNTSVKVLRSLGLARMWAEARGRDLDIDLSYGRFLSVQDADDLADFLRLNSGEQLRVLEDAKKRAVVSKVVRLETVRPDPRAAKRNLRPITNQEIANRLRWLARYVDWHLKRRVGDLARANAEGGRLQAIGSAVVERLRDLAPGVPARSENDPALEGVDRTVLDAIELALRPGSQANPFTPGFIQARNYLIWRLLYDTGARRHEVREGDISHVAYGAKRFEIHVSKTFARTVPIAATTADAFDDFVEHYWSKLPREARARGHLLTDRNGRHLSLRAINRIFETVRDRVPNVPRFMATHTLRRSWNDRFVAMIEAIPADKRPSSAAVDAQQASLQGWARGSKMPAMYSQRQIKKNADILAQRMFDGEIVPDPKKR